MQDRSLEIIYQDQRLVAINKPAGLLVHRSPIDRHETRFALQLLRDQLGQRVFPLHRLDKPTSGVLLFALDQDAARTMMPLVANGQLQKRYLAVVRGYAPTSSTIEHPLVEKHDSADPLKARSSKTAQAAITQASKLAQIELPWPIAPYSTARYSLLECQPKTGRRHQLRRHLKHINHPIIGDTTYGKGPHNRAFRERLGIKRLLLHALSIEFRSPWNSATMRLCAQPDDAFERLAQLGLSRTNQ